MGEWVKELGLVTQLLKSDYKAQKISYINPVTKSGTRISGTGHEAFQNEFNK